MKNVGKVYFVGAGPGDPKLITVKGLECLQNSDVIIYDRLANPELLTYAIPGTELIFCGKSPNNHTMKQEEINEMIVQQASDGKTITRLKGGDPCIFGRIHEEIGALQEYGIPFEIVPGITAGIAAPAYAGIPVTQRKVATSFAMVAGHLCHGNTISPEQWSALALGIDTIAFYMGIKNLQFICEQLIAYGRKPDTPAAMISWGTTKDQRTVMGSLRTLPALMEESKVANPAIILVGDVVAAQEQLDWFQPAVTNVS